jgi:hypothetical protein
MAASALCVALAVLASGPVPVASGNTCEAAWADGRGERIESSEHVVVFRTRPPRVPVGEFFVVEAVVCARGGAAPAALRVDAQMPEHRHGMNYRAKVSRQGDGRYLAEGLLLHMPGRWELVFEVVGDGRVDRLVSEVFPE